MHMSVLRFEISKLCNKMKTTLNKTDILNLSQNEIILAPGFNAFLFMLRSNEKQNPGLIILIPHLLKAIYYQINLHCITGKSLNMTNQKFFSKKANHKRFF